MLRVDLIGAGAGGILLLLALLHIYWAARSTAGWATVPSRPDGTPLFRPGPLATLAVAVALTLAALLLLGRSGVISQVGSPMPYRVGTWGVALVFALRAVGDFHYVGFFKSVVGTPFARLDTLCFTPLCAVLALASYFIARS